VAGPVTEPTRAGYHWGRSCPLTALPLRFCDAASAGPIAGRMCGPSSCCAACCRWPARACALERQPRARRPAAGHHRAALPDRSDRCGRGRSPPVAGLTERGAADHPEALRLMTQRCIEHACQRAGPHLAAAPPRRMARPRAARRESPIELFVYHISYIEIDKMRSSNRPTRGVSRQVRRSPRFMRKLTVIAATRQVNR
jgi:hypothetical protein